MVFYARWGLGGFMFAVWVGASLENIRLILMERRGAVLGGSPNLQPLMPVLPWVFGMFGIILMPFAYHFYFVLLPFALDPVNWYAAVNFKTIMKHW